MKRILIVDDVLGWQKHHETIVLEIFKDSEIKLASSAREAYDLILEYNANPFDIIITDMQMESDFEPKYAGEWLIEQIKTLKNYAKTKIVISSATYNIRQIAEFYNVECIPKKTALNFPDAYEIIK